MSAKVCEMCGNKINESENYSRLFKWEPNREGKMIIEPNEIEVKTKGYHCESCADKLERV